MIIVNGWSSPHQYNLESVRCVFNPMPCPKLSLKWSLSCLLLLIQSFWSSKKFQTDPKHCFLILADQACAPRFWEMFQHFVELFVAPWQVPSLTLSPRPYGPVQPEPAPGSPSAKALSHLSTEDQRALQRLQPHSCCTCQLPSLLHFFRSQHMCF